MLRRSRHSGNAAFATRSLTGFEVNTRRVFRWVRRGARGQTQSAMLLLLVLAKKGCCRLLILPDGSCFVGFLWHDLPGTKRLGSHFQACVRLASWFLEGSKVLSQKVAFHLPSAWGEGGTFAPSNQIAHLHFAFKRSNHRFGSLIIQGCL